MGGGATSAVSGAIMVRRSGLIKAWAAGLAAAALTAVVVPAGEVLPGPVPARVVRIIDGDTVIVRARIWLGQEVEIRVRLKGIDAPEANGRCADERELAKRAANFVRRRLDGGAVRLTHIEYGKYAGRVVARLLTQDGEDIAAALLQAGLARAYDGRRRRSWCDRAGRE